MRKTYQFRIYPGRKQEVVLNRTLSTCRHLYNDSQNNDGMIQILDIDTILSSEELRSMENGIKETSGGKNDGQNF